MNFLGHCYLCQDHMHLITGNLSGDSYKGYLSNFERLPLKIQQGIKLHRFIDDFTDQSAHISAVAHILQENGIQKVSFIACDILLDHYLSKNWDRYSTIPYRLFISQIYAEVEANLEVTEPEFQFLFNKMKEYGWFYEYPSIEGISLVLRQYSNRIKFTNQLGTSSEVYKTHEKTIEMHFEAFLNEIKTASAQFILEQKLDIH